MRVSIALDAINISVQNLDQLVAHGFAVNALPKMPAEKQKKTLDFNTRFVLL